MGDSSLTCSISGLGIFGGTPVRCLLLTASPYDSSGNSCSGRDPRRSWIVRTPPLRAVYDSYGSIEDVHEDDKFIADLWLRGLREDLVEKGQGDNAYHDLPASKTMSFGELLDAVRSGSVFVRQETKHFWRRPLIGVDDMLGDDARARNDATPSLRRIERVLSKDAELVARFPHPVSSSSQKDKFVVDEPVPHLVRVRFGQYQHGAEHLDALAAARGAIERAGFVGVVAAGSGRYSDTAELMVLPAPNDKHVHGPQWDMATGKSADDSKHLVVAMAMVREDVWQALVRYPHSDTVTIDCMNCGQQPWYHQKNRGCPNESINNKPFKDHPKGSRYEHGPVFSDGIEHLIVPGEYGRDTVWFDVSVFKQGTRETWDALVKRFRLEGQDPMFLADPDDDRDADVRRLEAKADPLITEIMSKLEARRKQEEDRLAALPSDERAEIEAKRKADREAREAQDRDRKENPIFGDFLISDYMIHDTRRPGAWVFRDSVPGVIGISEHLSMCIADKIEVPTSTLDAIAELSAVSHHFRNICVTWKPAQYTGPQYEEWTHEARFLATLSKIVDDDQKRRHHDDDDDDEKSATYASEPATLAEAFSRYGAKKAPT